MLDKPKPLRELQYIHENGIHLQDEDQDFDYEIDSNLGLIESNN